MNDHQTIKKAFERNEKVLIREPSLARKKGAIKVRLDNGLACEIESGPWKFKADMPERVGGSETAPTPGIYEAAALGSCMAIMAKLWAAKLDVPLNTIEVNVEFDADKRYLFGLGEVPARWKSIQYHISIESTAPKAEVMRVLNIAHKQSHVRGDFEHLFKVERKISIQKPVKAEPT